MAPRKRREFTAEQKSEAVRLTKRVGILAQVAREQGMSLREVAACMGRSREATKKLYGRALSRFTEEFQRRGGMTHG